MNFRLLEAELKKNGLTIAQFCEAIGISCTKYFRCKKGKGEFAQKDIAATIRTLNISDVNTMISIFYPDTMPIFFTEKVS